MLEFNVLFCWASVKQAGERFKQIVQLSIDLTQRSLRSRNRLLHKTGNGILNTTHKIRRRSPCNL